MEDLPRTCLSWWKCRGWKSAVVTCEVTLKEPKLMTRPGKGGMSSTVCCSMLMVGVMAVAKKHDQHPSQGP